MSKTRSLFVTSFGFFCAMVSATSLAVARTNVAPPVAFSPKPAHQPIAHQTIDGVFANFSKPLQNIALQNAQPLDLLLEGKSLDAVLSDLVSQLKEKQNQAHLIQNSKALQNGGAFKTALMAQSGASQSFSSARQLAHGGSKQTTTSDHSASSRSKHSEVPAKKCVATFDQDKENLQTSNVQSQKNIDSRATNSHTPITPLKANNRLYAPSADLNQAEPVRTSSVTSVNRKHTDGNINRPTQAHSIAGNTNGRQDVDINRKKYSEMPSHLSNDFSKVDDINNKEVNRKNKIKKNVNFNTNKSFDNQKEESSHSSTIPPQKPQASNTGAKNDTSQKSSADRPSATTKPNAPPPPPKAPPKAPPMPSGNSAGPKAKKTPNRSGLFDDISGFNKSNLKKGKNTSQKPPAAEKPSAQDDMMAELNKVLGGNRKRNTATESKQFDPNCIDKTMFEAWGYEKATEHFKKYPNAKVEGYMPRFADKKSDAEIKAYAKQAFETEMEAKRCQFEAEKRRDEQMAKMKAKRAKDGVHDINNDSDDLGAHGRRSHVVNKKNLSEAQKKRQAEIMKKFAKKQSGQSSANAASGRGGLFEQIRRGFSLKKTNLPNQKKKKKPVGGQGDADLAAAAARAMNNGSLKSAASRQKEENPFMGWSRQKLNDKLKDPDISTLHEMFVKEALKKIEAENGIPGLMDELRSKFSKSGQKSTKRKAPFERKAEKAESGEAKESEKNSSTLDEDQERQNDGTGTRKKYTYWSENVTIEECDD